MKRCSECGEEVYLTGTSGMCLKCERKLEDSSKPETIANSAARSSYAVEGNGGRNLVATILVGIAIATYLFGFILGIVLRNSMATVVISSITLKATEPVANNGAMFVTWIFALIFGTCILGFAEVISLLDKISKK